MEISSATLHVGPGGNKIWEKAINDDWSVEYTPDYQLVRTIKMMGCWVSGMSEDDFDHNSNDKHSMTATIEFDKAWVDTSDI